MATNTENLNERVCHIMEKEGVYSGVLRKVQMCIFMVLLGVEGSGLLFT